MESHDFVLKAGGYDRPGLADAERPGRFRSVHPILNPILCTHQPDEKAPPHSPTPKPHPRAPHHQATPGGRGDPHHQRAKAGREGRGWGKEGKGRGKEGKGQGREGREAGKGKEARGEGRREEKATIGMHSVEMASGEIQRLAMEKQAVVHKGCAENAAHTANASRPQRHNESSVRKQMLGPPGSPCQQVFRAEAWGGHGGGGEGEGPKQL